MKDIITDDKNRFKVIKWLNNFIKTYKYGKSYNTNLAVLANAIGF